MLAHQFYRVESCSTSEWTEYSQSRMGCQATR